MNTKLKLQALAAAALALPGLAGADEMPTTPAPSTTTPAANISLPQNDFKFGYRFHHYSEDSLGPEATGNLNGDSSERYEVRANQFNLAADFEDFSVTVDYQHENMAGASAWFTLKNPDGQVTQVMSGASISDSREDIKVSGAYRLDNKTFGLTVASSDEDDYDSLSMGGSVSFDFDQRLNTITLSADFANDDIEPVDTDQYTNRVHHRGKHSTSMLAAYSRVIDQNSLIQFALGYTRKSGYLSDPYKQVFVNFQLLNDSRPDQRTSRTFSAKYRYYLAATDGAIHADYRYYTDSWDIDAHTFDFSYHQPLPWGIQLIPSIRFYQQDESYFYQHYYDNTRPDGYYSTDYRLPATVPKPTV